MRSLSPLRPCVITALALLSGCGIVPETHDPSDYFRVKDHSWGRLFANHADVFVRSERGGFEYLGSTWGKHWYDPYDPGAIKAQPIACSSDGRALVWAHAPKLARDRSTKEQGIYQHVYGEGDRLIKAGAYTATIRRPPKPFPSNILAASGFVGTRVMAVTAEGEIFDMALLGASDLHKAAFEGDDARIVALLAAGHGVNDENYWGQTPLELAWIRDNEEAAARLLANGAETTVEGFKLLHLAAKVNDVRMLEILLEAGADPDVVDPDGRTALLDAVFQFRVPSSVHSLPRWRNRRVYGSDPQTSKTPMIASLDVLMAYGADVNARDANGRTALHYIVRSPGEEDAPSIVRFLVAHGADPNARDAEGKTALHLAIQHFESASIVQALVRHGADANIADEMGNMPLHLVNRRFVADNIFWDEQGRPALEMLMSETVEIDRLNSDGLSPLHVAVQRSVTQPAELLIANGADDSVRYRPVDPQDTGLSGRDVQSKRSRRMLREQIQKVKQSAAWIERFVDDPLPIDDVGNTPKDVAEAFLRALGAGDFEAAKSYWTDVSAQRWYPNGFEKHCTKTWARFDHVEFSEPRNRGNGFFRMTYEGFVGDERKAKWWIDFRLVDGRWRLW